MKRERGKEKAKNVRCMTDSVFQIRLLNAKDGSPHHLPLNNTIRWDTGFNNGLLGVRCTKMTASRLLVSFSVSAIDMFIVWNWRTGNPVGVSDFPSIPSLTSLTTAGS